MDLQKEAVIKAAMEQPLLISEGPLEIRPWHPDQRRKGSLDVVMDANSYRELPTVKVQAPPKELIDRETGLVMPAEKLEAIKRWVAMMRRKHPHMKANRLMQKCAVQFHLKFVNPKKLNDAKSGAATERPQSDQNQPGGIATTNAEPDGDR